MKLRLSGFRVHAFNCHAVLPLLKMSNLFKHNKERTSVTLSSIIYFAWVKFLPAPSLILMPYFKIVIKSIISILISVYDCFNLEV